MNFDVYVSKQYQNVVIYKIQGEFTLSRTTEDLVKDILNRTRTEQLRVVIFDLKDMFYINSQGIGILVKTYKLLSEREAGLAVAGLQEQVFRVLSDMGIFRFIFKFMNLVEACSNYGVDEATFVPESEIPKEQESKE